MTQCEGSPHYGDGWGEWKFLTRRMEMNKAQIITIAITLLVMAASWFYEMRDFYMGELISHIIPFIFIGGAIVTLFGLKKRNKKE